jgi:hypothetical protein
MQQGAHNGMQFTLEAVTLLSDENAWRVIYTGPLLETRVPNIPPITAFKMRLTVPVSRLLCRRVPLLLFTLRGCLQVPTDFGCPQTCRFSPLRGAACLCAQHVISRRCRDHECQRH